MTLVGCREGNTVVEPVVEPQEQPQEQDEPGAISFTSNMPEETAVTRANLEDVLSNKTFKVWGYKNMSYSEPNYGELQTVMPCYTVNWVANTAYTTTSNTHDWEYVGQGTDQDIKYWDFNAKAYRFFAATGWGGDAPAPLADATKSYKSAEDATSYSITMLADASDADEMEKTPFFSRLWFSTGDPVAYADKQFGQPVTLEFVKPYSRVRFMFMYVFPRVAYNIGTLSFKPTTDGTKIIRKGTVTVTYPKSGAQTREQYAVVGNTDPDLAVSKALAAFTVDYDPEDEDKNYVTLSSGAMTSDGWYTVLPNTSQGSYTLTADINGEDRTVVVPAQFMQWKPGYQYTYIFKITEEGGVEIGWVEYAVMKWTEMEGDWDVYNW